MAKVPPWVWIIVALIVLLIGAWATNMACPTFGRSCPVQQQQPQTSSGGRKDLTPEELALIQSYF